MTDEELEQAKAEIHDLFEDVREDLAEDLDGDPDDYRADPAVTDGGD
jgi:hypothetical protein